jgi:ZIP family zinc transporter
MDPLSSGLILGVAAACATFLGLIPIALKKEPNERFLAFTLLIVAGAMLTISIGQILPTSVRQANTSFSKLSSVAVFTSGILLILIFSIFDQRKRGSSTRRSLIFTAFALSLHNFPEGATAVGATLISFDTGLSTALVLALHNIPEGLAIASLAALAKVSTLKGASLVALATAAEILGSLTFFTFGKVMTSDSTGILLAFVAGIMVAISAKELIPYSARILLQPRKR